MLEAAQNEGWELVVPDEPKLRDDLRGARDDLIAMLEQYSGEVPSEMIHGTMRYKVQKNWFAIVVTNFDYLRTELLERNPAHPKLSELAAELALFGKIYSSFEFNKRRTTENDVRIADSLIKRLLSALSAYFPSIFNLH